MEQAERVMARKRVETAMKSLDLNMDEMKDELIEV